MMPSEYARKWINADTTRREKKLPFHTTCGRWVLSLQGVGQIHFPKTRSSVVRVQSFGAGDLTVKTTDNVFSIQKYQCIQCQALCRNGTTPPFSQIAKKLFDFKRPHLFRVPLSMKMYESNHPMHVCFFRGIAQTAAPNGQPQLVDEPGGFGSNRWSNIIHEKLQCVGGLRER